MARTSITTRILAVVIAALALVLITAAPGSAHSRLVSTNPADGETLATSPATVSFTFDEPLLDGMNTISINDANGEMVTSSPVTPQGTVISLTLDTPLAAGDYQAAYRVVSADGHAVMGAISFSVAGGSAQPSATASPAGSASAVPPTTASSVAPSPAPSSPAVAGSTTSWVLWLAIAVVAIAVIAGVGFALRRGR